MKKKISVEGMKCENCAKHVKDALLSMDGIISAEVNLSDKTVIVEASIDVSNESIKDAVNNGKYKVVEIETL